MAQIQRRIFQTFLLVLAGPFTKFGQNTRLIGMQFAVIGAGEAGRMAYFYIF